MAAVKELLKELKKHGYKYKDPNQIFTNNRLDPVEVSLILKWLPEIYSEHLGTGVILAQSLKSAKGPFDPSLLIKLFEESDLNSSVKSGIGYAIVDSKTGDISGWIKKQLLTGEYTLEKSALVSGLPQRGRFKRQGDLKDFLELIFDKYPISVLELYNKIGNKSDIDFLLEKISSADKKIAKEVEKTLKKILKKEGISK